ncbi:uncharacterized protein BDR25DRAFT_347949 [Lindgomyces ingoldianus]|uniref:Uncharacterized protein n=1 Tax=Lindgomyces ingoldianus TaxID=673940 RepID=A0ACB6REY9_9PLEO|nr:uncharacterized protein BDR25DRAFT_347949 [Lindgomyces ingoldianus]KAF2477615.1 hypothetical protein BDR25DRAFT_347949 [Lindgomyces ingoldianus]
MELERRWRFVCYDNFRSLARARFELECKAEEVFVVFETIDRGICLTWSNWTPKPPFLPILSAFLGSFGLVLFNSHTFKTIIVHSSILLYASLVTLITTPLPSSLSIRLKPTQTAPHKMDFQFSTNPVQSAGIPSVEMSHLITVLGVFGAIICLHWQQIVDSIQLLLEPPALTPPPQNGEKNFDKKEEVEKETEKGGYKGLIKKESNILAAVVGVKHFLPIRATRDIDAKPKESKEAIKEEEIKKDAEQEETKDMIQKIVGISAGTLNDRKPKGSPTATEDMADTKEPNGIFEEALLKGWIGKKANEKLAAESPTTQSHSTQTRENTVAEESVKDFNEPRMNKKLIHSSNNAPQAVGAHHELHLKPLPSIPQESWAHKVRAKTISHRQNGNKGDSSEGDAAKTNAVSTPASLDLFAVVYHENKLGASVPVSMEKINDHQRARGISIIHRQAVPSCDMPACTTNVRRQQRVNFHGSRRHIATFPFSSHQTPLTPSLYELARNVVKRKVFQIERKKDRDKIPLWQPRMLLPVEMKGCFRYWIVATVENCMWLRRSLTFKPCTNPSTLIIAITITATHQELQNPPADRFEYQSTSAFYLYMQSSHPTLIWPANALAKDSLAGKGKIWGRTKAVKAKPAQSASQQDIPNIHPSMDNRSTSRTPRNEEEMSTQSQKQKRK